jgi:hypothetical protein
LARLRTTAAVVLASATLACAPNARAECTADTHVSTCIAADTFWAHPAPGPFSFVAPADTLASGAIAAGLTATYVARPIVLDVPSADPAGAEFEAVASQLDATLLGAYGVAPGIEADVALPVTLARSGVGVSPLTDQRTTALSGSSFGDVRAGAAFRMLRAPPEQGLGFRVAARLDLALPTGDKQAFAGERTLVVAPAVSGVLESGRWFAGAELGARLRGANDLAGSRVGSQLLVALGAGASLLDQGALSVQIEAIALPTTAAQHQLGYVAASGQREVVGSGTALVPAEWLLSLRALFTPSISANAGAGGALPFFGASDMTAPRFRLVLALRFAFAASDAR